VTRQQVIIFCVTLACLCTIARAQVAFTVTTSADAFLATGSTNNPVGVDLAGLNFGAAGTLVIAPASSVKGEFQSVIQFNLAGATNFFNATCGTNNWTITGLLLELTSNYGTAGVQPNNAIFPVINGGKFVITWLANNDWTEGTGTPNLPTTDGVTYNSLPGLLAGAHEILGTNTYLPPGNNVPLTYVLPLTANLVAEVASDSNVSLLFYAADAQIGYLFNSYSYGRGNEPLIHVTANPLPPKILSGCFTNGLFHLAGIGGMNLQYQVQTSSNLGITNWQTIGTATADSAGMIQFDDTNATNQPQRFYRFSH
jgi:hypothetical protein